MPTANPEGIAIEACEIPIDLQAILAPKGHRQATRATVDAPISYGAAIAVELDIEAIERRCEGLRGSLGVHGKISSERCGCREKRAANHARKHGRRIQGASSGHDHPYPDSFVSPMARHCH